MGAKRNRRWDEMDKSRLPLEKLIAYFETYNRSEGKSPRTVHWYNEVLHLFLRWLDDSGYPTALGGMDEDTVRKFVLWLQERRSPRGKPSTHTINNRVRALRAFFNWLYHRGYTEAHLLKDLRPPKLSRPIIEPLTDEEVARLFEHQDPSTAMGARNTAILAVFLDAGLRLSELVGLGREDVHVEEQYVKVSGKGDKERIVPFGIATKKALVHYWIHFRPDEAHAAVREFFLSLDGLPLTGEGIRSFLERLATAAKVPRLHAHLLRHTYATNFLLNGGDALLLKHNLGHSTLTMVDGYVHLASRRAAIASRSFSPLDRMNIKGLRRHAGARWHGEAEPRAYRQHRSGARQERPGQGRGRRL